MTTRIGVGIAADSVCVVMTRDRSVEWSTVDIIDGDGLDATLTRAFDKLPKLSWPRPRVHAGVGTEHAYVKTIHALPMTRDARALGRIVAAAPSRFFLLSAGGATVTGVRVVENGVVRAAIVGNHAIGLLQKACAGNGLLLARVVPGDIALSALGDEECLDSCALALGATLVDRREPIVARLGRRHAPERSIGAARLALAAGTAVMALIAAMIFPTLARSRQASIAQHRIASLAPVRARALTAEHGLFKVSRMLTAVSDFEQGRTSVTWILGQVVNALPRDAAIVSVRIERAAVTLTAIANRATDVVSGIQDMPHASQVEMAGPITYEGGAAVIDGSEESALPAMPAARRERVSIRFRLAAEPDDLRTPLTGESGAKQ